jgi:hypothetical protein
MILRLDKYIAEQEETKVTTPKKLSIKWEKPDLAEEIEHYNNKAKLEFYQHNIDIPNTDIKKVKKAIKEIRSLKEVFVFNIEESECWRISKPDFDEEDGNCFSSVLKFDLKNCLRG